ncbi:MAG: glycosyltransferase family 2 protein [Candidatus Bipolaricaulota bacterium]|nr:MAG: glycosyltransferase family 2 protein [Candidatus Bipolaricaulota bacterium]
MNVSVVVPAYNEASRIAAVLEPLLACHAVTEIIVVDDGSDDGTAAVASTYPVRVVRLDENRGKAAALDEGVRAASHDVLCFLDADLVGLRVDHIQRMIDAYQEGKLDMVVGVFANGRKNTDLAQKINPFASGQRILSRSLWQRTKENIEEMDYGIEIALSRLAAKEGWEKEKVKLEGVTHVLKEEKRGFAAGVKDRLKMYGDMVKWLIKKL